jgi:hypothetical protein
MIKIGKTLSPLGKNNNRLRVAAACPAVVNSACVVVAVPHLAAAGAGPS